jgi:uncharacterized RDD family membrane protein YckC
MTAAKLPDRFLAYLVDTFPFWIGFKLTSGALGAGLAAGGWTLAYVAYHAVGNSAGATPGKRLLGLRVVAADGGPLGFRRSLARAAGLLLSTPLCNLGFLWAFFQPESRAWHDLIAGSRVVEAAPKTQRQAFVAGALSSTALGVLLILVAWKAFFRVTPEDAAAIARAREGLRILAQIEEQYKARHGAYTPLLSELAETSGDVQEFARSMGEIFEPSQFQIKASRSRYYLRARAKDSRRTLVGLRGP